MRRCVYHQTMGLPDKAGLKQMLGLGIKQGLAIGNGPIKKPRSLGAFQEFQMEII